jgi:hypothetical protein
MTVGHFLMKAQRRRVTPVRLDGILYYGAVQTMPYARTLFSELLQAIDFTIANDYPARGDV